MVPKKDIVENDYDLSINKYKEIEYTPVEYPPTSEIMANIRELELEIGKEMDELERLLDYRRRMADSKFGFVWDEYMKLNLKMSAYAIHQI